MVKAKKAQPALELTDILKNAASSIQLGIEDFELSRDIPGKDARALSAARNIYSGVLLLFKYKIASLAKSPGQVRELLYVPRSILPTITDNGDITWSPSVDPKDTINTAMIKARLDSLGIYNDWDAVVKLRNCRNALEHLHPTDPISGIQAAIAGLFTMLQRFITDELGEAPAALLGDSWATMLATHEFNSANVNRIEREWGATAIPYRALGLLKESVCPCCLSPLLQPLKADVENGVSINDAEFRFECLACHHSDSLLDLLQENFALAHEDPFNSDGVEHILECNLCFVHMFLIDDGICHWCGYAHEWPKCSLCENPVSEYAAAEGGTLCDRCCENEWHLRQS